MLWHFFVVVNSRYCRQRIRLSSQQIYRYMDKLFILGGRDQH